MDASDHLPPRGSTSRRKLHEGSEVVGSGRCGPSDAKKTTAVHSNQATTASRRIGPPVDPEPSLFVQATTGLTWLAMRGDNPLTIRYRAGHANFRTTEGYIRRGRNAQRLGDPFPVLPANVVRPQTVPGDVPPTGRSGESTLEIDPLHWRPQRDLKPSKKSRSGVFRARSKGVKSPEPPSTSLVTPRTPVV
jgi:hypothetical protein